MNPATGRAWSGQSGAFVALLLAPLAVGASFSNLDFDFATLPSIPYGQFGTYQPISAALPGWAGYLGTTPTSHVLHNNFTLGSAAIWIWGPSEPYGFNRLDGRFTVRLVPGAYLVGTNPPANVGVSISQTGEVPLGTRSLRFKASDTATSSWQNAFAVYANNEQLSLTPLLVGTNFTMYGADVTPLAGQEVELRFSLFYIDYDGNSVLLDSISFSSEPIPEPAIFPSSRGPKLASPLLGNAARARRVDRVRGERASRAVSELEFKTPTPGAPRRLRGRA